MMQDIEPQIKQLLSQFDSQEISFELSQSPYENGGFYISFTTEAFCGYIAFWDNGLCDTEIFNYQSEHPVYNKNISYTSMDDLSQYILSIIKKVLRKVSFS